MSQSNTNNASPSARTPYFMGIVTGASVALAAFTMMGQGYSRPNEPKTGAPATTPAAPQAAAGMPEKDEYFVTAGNSASTTARLWRRPAGSTTLEFLGEHQPTSKGR
jgi:hypothetical protein